MWEMHGFTALRGRTSPMDSSAVVCDDIGITIEYRRQLGSNANKERRQYRWNLISGVQASVVIGHFTLGDGVCFVML